jgi:hypothetical protein
MKTVPKNETNMNSIVSIRKINNSIKSTIEQSLLDIGGIKSIIATDDNVLLKPKESVKYDFKKVNLQEIIENKLNIQNNDACSSCMNALILSIMCCQGLDFSDKTFYLGSKFTSIDDPNKKIAFGKCCIDRLEGTDYKRRGCPPYPVNIR